MQIVNGAMPPEKATIQEIRKYIPSRLIRLFLYVAGLERGQHVILLNVGDDHIDWRVGELGKRMG